MLRTLTVLTVVGTLGLVTPIASPTVARAGGDDWEDRLEDLEDYYEDLAERYEDQQEARYAARHRNYYGYAPYGYRRPYVQPYGYYRAPTHPYRHYYPHYTYPHHHGYWMRVGPLQFHWH